MKTTQKKRGHMCLITTMIILAVAGITACGTPAGKTQEETTVDVYVNAMDFKGISESDCVDLVGEPNSVEEWTYESGTATRACKSYYYDKYELVFMRTTDQIYVCVRMKVYDKDISFDKDTVVQQFGFDKSRNEKDTGFSYRCDAIDNEQNLYVDFWISSYEDGKIKMLDITYVANAF